MNSAPASIARLLQHSMLEQAKAIAARFSGQGRMWGFVVRFSILCKQTITR